MPTSGPSILDFKLKWRVGARTGLLIAKTAGRFASKITLISAGLRVNAKHLMGVMLLGEYRPKLPDGSYNFGPDAGTHFQLSVEGPDAVPAFATMADLFTCGERVVQCRNSDCISSAILIDFSASGIIYSCSNCHIWIIDRGTGLTLSPSPRDLGIKVRS